MPLDAQWQPRTDNRPVATIAKMGAVVIALTSGRATFPRVWWIRSSWNAGNASQAAQSHSTGVEIAPNIL
jgi:hypothetical protein